MEVTGESRVGETVDWDRVTGSRLKGGMDSCKRTRLVEVVDVRVVDEYTERGVDFGVYVYVSGQIIKHKLASRPQWRLFPLIRRRRPPLSTELTKMDND